MFFSSKDNHAHRFRLTNYAPFNDKWAPEFSCKVPDTESGPGMIFKAHHSGSMGDEFGIFTFESFKLADDKKLVDIWNGEKDSYFEFFGDGTLKVKNNLEAGGIVKASEIIVTPQTADFVFAEEYKLRPLSEVEEFVEANHHLPEVPSAIQMEAEGVDLAEMNKLLLQKIEELTLYTIEQEKKLIQKENKINGLEQRLLKIEELLIKQPGKGQEKAH